MTKEDIPEILRILEVAGTPSMREEGEEKIYQLFDELEESARENAKSYAIQLLLELSREVETQRRCRAHNCADHIMCRGRKGDSHDRNAVIAAAKWSAYCDVTRRINSILDRIGYKEPENERQ